MKNTRNLIAALFLSLLLAAGTSCSSNDKKDEGVSPDVAEATSDAGAPADGTDAPPADGSQAQADNPDSPPPADGAQANNGDQPPADQNADPDAAALDAPPTPSDTAKAPESTESDMASADQPPADPNSPPPAADVPPAAGPDTAAPPADAPPAPDTAAPPPADTSSSNSNGTDAFGAAAATDTTEPAPVHKRKSATLTHIKDAPFTKGGQNLNTVYIARDGDTLDSISQKLFGEDHTQDLKKANPTLKKGVKTGDKVYFNSPNRPDDKDKMMTVYEDQGLPPSVYTTKEGDTLKSLAQEWYGSEGSYKEIYAINKSLTSTKDLPAGTELQYWPASASVAVYGAKAPDVAQANTPPAPPPGNNPPPPPPGAPGAQGQPNNMMANNNPPPPAGAGMMGAPGAPGAGGPDQAAVPPAAPPPDMGMMPPKAHKPPKDLSNPGAMDKDTIFYAGLAGILLISSALWFALRRRRSRNSGVTQI